MLKCSCCAVVQTWRQKSYI